MMNNDPATFNIKKSALKLLLFTSILFGIHYITISTYFDQHDFFFETWKIYGFHFLTVLIVIYLLYKRSLTKPTSVFYVFIGLSVLKMFAALIFLSPLFFNKEIDPIPPVFGFFIPYFLFLAFESMIAISILNPQK